MSDKQFDAITLRIIQKLDAMDARLDSIDKTLTRQHADIEYHIKRTDLLEASIVPIKKHVTMVEAVFKVFASVGAVGAFLVSVFKLTGTIK